ncbi:MAG: hypothetical protein WC485_12435 [Opitutaceae bacterium]
MRYVLVLVVTACTILAACGTPQITMPIGAAAVAWGDARAMYATGTALAIQLRKDGKIDDAAWEDLKALDVKAKVYRQQIEKALLTPEVPVDYEKIMQYSGEAIDLLLKLGITVAK